MKLRVSVRTLLWLIVVVALSTAWWVDRQRIETRHRDLRNLLSQSESVSELRRLDALWYAKKLYDEQLSKTAPPFDGSKTED